MAATTSVSLLAFVPCATPLRQSLPAILFDLDGTLIDTIELILSSARHAFEGWPRAHRRTRNGSAALARRSSTSFAHMPRTKTKSPCCSIAIGAYQHEHHDRLTRCYDDVPESWLAWPSRGHPLGDRDQQGVARSPTGASRYVGLDRYFPVVVGYDETTRHKPDPEPVLVALRPARRPGRAGPCSSGTRRTTSTPETRPGS